MAENVLPRDLQNAQLLLHQARAAYEQHCRTLLWTGEPDDDWSSIATQLRIRLLELSSLVSAHPHWKNVVGEGVAEQHMALKQVHGAVGPSAEAA